MLTWDTYILGARLFLWAELLTAIMGALIVVLYTQRERLRKTYYALRFPQQLLILNVIYPAGYVRHFYRLIPDLGDKSFSIAGGTYNYNEEAILRTNDFFARRGKDGSLTAKIDGETYNLNESLSIKERWEAWPQLYFIYGNPWPIDFKNSKPNELQYNTRDFQRFKESKKLNEIYSALTQDSLMIVVIVLTIITFLISLANFAKNMGWLK